MRSGCEMSRGSGESLFVGYEKWLTSGDNPKLKLDCRSREKTGIPKDLTSDVTDLDLAGNNISCIFQDDFLNTQNLRVLILSNNGIKSLHNGCFRLLLHLEQLDLSGNSIASFPSGVFTGLHSLRILTMSGLPLTSYPTKFVAHTPEVRVLSLGAVGAATIPAEYARLPRLEVLDLYKESVKLTKITVAMFDKIRDSKITTLAIRNMYNIKEVRKGAFSNLPADHSIILACNRYLHYRPTVAALAATTNTSIDTVVLDGALAGNAPQLFNEADFCLPFWRRVQRLSLKSARISYVVFNHAGCLTQLRELKLEYNSIKSVTPPDPTSPPFSRMFEQSAFLIVRGITTRILTPTAGRTRPRRTSVATSQRSRQYHWHREPKSTRTRTRAAKPGQT